MEKQSKADIVKDPEKPDEVEQLAKLKVGQRQPVQKMLLKRSRSNDELQNRERLSQQKVRIQDHTLASTSQNMTEFQEEPKATVINVTVQNIAKTIVASGGNMQLHETGCFNTIAVGDGSMNVEGCKSGEKVLKGQGTKKFLDTVNDNTKEKIRYDVRGERKTLCEVEKPPQPLYEIIEIEESGTDEQGPKVKAIGKVELNQIHDGLCRHSSLVGDAGEGKTTSSKQYAEYVLNQTEGLNQTECLKGIELVLFIEMIGIDTRDTTTPFRLLITKQLGKLEKGLERAGKAWMEENSDKILFIFDGLDQSALSPKDFYLMTDHESPTSPLTIVANILSGHIYSGAKILTTSRWHSFWTLGNNLKPDRIVALRGFSETEKLKLFKLVLPSSDADSIIDQIRNAPNLLFLCSTPNILMNTASVFSKSRNCRPETQSEILGWTVRRLLESKTAPGKWDFPLKLSGLAYKGIIDNIFQFSARHLNEVNLQMSDVHDFMGTDVISDSDQGKVLEADKRCYFHHQTIQEFFAALHICNANDITPYLEKIFEDARLANVLLFLSGIVAHERTFSLVRKHILNGEFPKDKSREMMKKKILSTLRDGCITDIKICRTLMECDSDFFNDVAKSVKGVGIDTREVLEPRDSFVISSLISSLVCKLGRLPLVKLPNLELDSTTVTLLSSCVNSIECFQVVWQLTLGASLSKDHKSDILKVLSKVEIGTIASVEIDCGDDVAVLSLNHLKGKGVYEIALDGNKNIGHQGLYSVVDFFQDYHDLVGPALIMRNCDLDDEKLEAIFNHSKGKQLKLCGIDLDGNTTIGLQGFCSLVDLIQYTHLLELSIAECNLDDEKIKAMADHSKGKELKLKWVTIGKNPNIGPEGCKLLVDFLKQTELWRLSMRDCKLTTNKLKAMTDQIRATNLEIPELNMSENIPSDPKYMDQMIELISSADSRKVMMWNCKLTVDQVESLSRGMVEKKIILEELHLHENIPNPEKEYLPAICRLFHCVNDRIWLGRWQFDDGDVATLREELEKSQFKELKVTISDKSGKLVTLKSSITGNS